MKISVERIDGRHTISCQRNEEKQDKRGCKRVKREFLDWRGSEANALVPTAYYILVGNFSGRMSQKRGIGERKQRTSLLVRQLDRFAAGEKGSLKSRGEFGGRQLAGRQSCRTTG